MRRHTSIDSKEQLIFDKNWCRLNIASAFVSVFNFYIPHFSASLRVHRDYMIIACSRENKTVSHRDAAEPARTGSLVDPALLAGSRIKGKEAAIPVYELENPICYE